MHPASSYGPVKHRVEEYFGTYVSNGAFIAAVLYLGIKNKQLVIPILRYGIQRKHQIV